LIEYCSPKELASTIVNGLESYLTKENAKIGDLRGLAHE